MTKLSKCTMYVCDTLVTHLVINSHQETPSSPFPVITHTELKKTKEEVRDKE